MAALSVNIDHIATLREARRTYEPDPVWAAALAELGGADGITLHLREDRRHMQERDLRLLRETAAVPLNLEIAAAAEVLHIACHTQPRQVTLVPENRQEVTTEGGLDLLAQPSAVAQAVRQLQEAGIRVSLFLDPDPAQIQAARQAGADAVELHTGQYALATGSAQQKELERLSQAGAVVRKEGMLLHAGHGLHYRNVGAVARLEGICELNIGHSIICRAVFVGLQQAVREMKQLCGL